MDLTDCAYLIVRASAYKDYMTNMLGAHSWHKVEFVAVMIIDNFPVGRNV